MKAKHLVVTAGGVLHDVRVATERCNLDDAVNARPVDQKALDGYVPSTHVEPWRLCKWCYPE